MNDIIIKINYIGHIFLIGIIDSISYHKTLPILILSSQIASDFFQCFLANGFLLLGSLFFFYKGIIPLTNYLRTELVEEVEELHSNSLLALTNFSIWSFYHILWIFPIWIICYVTSLGWCQSIAYNSFLLQQKSSTSSSLASATQLKQNLVQSVYTTLVWFLTYLQAVFFYKLIPFLLHSLTRFLKFSIFSSFPTYITNIILLPLSGLSLLSFCVGFFMTSILYGWYPFDMIWLSNLSASPSPSSTYSSSPAIHTSLLQYYNRIETYWIYFFGFGLPFTLLFYNTSFFVGYGIYLMIFPLSIMVASVSNYQYDTYISISKKYRFELPPFRLFRYSVYFANFILSYINKKFFRISLPPSQSSRSSSSSSSSSKFNSTNSKESLYSKKDK